MEGNAVDRQVVLTLTLTGDFCYNLKPFTSPKIFPKEHTVSKVQNGHSTLIKKIL